MTEAQEKIQNAIAKLPPLPWSVWTSCSYRRIMTQRGHNVLHGVVQRADNHPDLSMNASDLNYLVDIINSAAQVSRELDEAMKRIAELEEEISDMEELDANMHGHV
tara:strand:- start:1220 stop:1537 length:318 start_codon:yes stop_codon:yes gene_type:complete